MASEEVSILVALVGAREFMANAQGTAAATGEIGVAADLTGRQMQVAGRRTFVFQQEVFTLRRVIYAGTLALLAAGSAALYLGWSYQTAMQTASVALAPVFTTTQALNAELDHLFRFSAFTPFQFKDITVAFRQMYAAFHPLGIDLATTNTTIQAIADALSFTGRTTPAALNRVAVALQHMAYMGHLTGQVVLQLARDGLPIYPALQKELGLTADQIHNIGSQGISSLAALQALSKYIETTPGFKGAALRQATMTLPGAFTTFKDLLSQAIGGAQHGMFIGLQKMFKDVDYALAPFYNNKKPITFYAIADAFDQAVSPKSHVVINLFVLLENTMRGLVWEFGQIFRIVGFVTSGFGLLGSGTGASRFVMMLFGRTLSVVLLGLIAYKTGLIAAQVWTRLATVATYAWRTAQIATWIVMGILTGTIWADIAATTAYTVVMGLLTGAVDLATGAFFALAVAMYANPIGLIIAGIVLLVGGLVVLYFKWRAFHDLVNGTFDWIRSHWALIVGFLAGPVGLAVVEIVRYWHTLQNAARAVWNFIKHVFGKITIPIGFSVHLPGSGLFGAVTHLTGNALGGLLHSAEHLGTGAYGLAQTGERAATNLWKPPTSHAYKPDSYNYERGSGVSFTIDNHFKADLHLPNGKVIAELVADVVTDKAARL